MWKIGIGTAALLILLIGGFAFWKPSSPTPAPETPTSTEPVKLVADIWFPTEKIELVQGTNTRFRSGSDVWFPVEPLVDLEAFDRMPTYYAVITFGEDTNFTESSLPQLQYRVRTADMYFYEPYLTHQFFYGSDGNVAGFLLMGDVPEDQDVTLIVQNVAQIYRTNLHITTERDETDYSQYTTRQLLEKLCFNTNLTRLRPEGSYGTWTFDRITKYNIEYFVNHDPAAAELLKREGAVDVMFHMMNTLGYTFDVRYNILLLLQYEEFYKQMSPEQLSQFEIVWEETYGDLEDWNDSYTAYIHEDVIVLPPESIIVP